MLCVAGCVLVVAFSGLCVVHLVVFAVCCLLCGALCVRRLLFPVCRSLFVVCLLCVACCLPCVVSRVVFVVCSLMFSVRCVLLVV